MAYGTSSRCHPKSTKTYCYLKIDQFTPITFYKVCKAFFPPGGISINHCEPTKDGKAAWGELVWQNRYACIWCWSSKIKRFLQYRGSRPICSCKVKVCILFWYCACSSNVDHTWKSMVLFFDEHNVWWTSLYLVSKLPHVEDRTTFILWIKHVCCYIVDGKLD